MTTLECLKYSDRLVSLRQSSQNKGCATAKQADHWAFPQVRNRQMVSTDRSFIALPDGRSQAVSSSLPPNSMYHPSQMSAENHPESATPSGGQPYQQTQPTPDSSAQAQYPPYPYDIQMKFPQSRSNPQYPHPPGLPLPPMTAPIMQEHNYPAPQGAGMDTTGQIAPPGMKPKVTATLWEDEGTICFQVDVKGTCVARREGKPMTSLSAVSQFLNSKQTIT